MEWREGDRGFTCATGSPATTLLWTLFGFVRIRASTGDFWFATFRPRVAPSSLRPCCSTSRVVPGPGIKTMRDQWLTGAAYPSVAGATIRPSGLVVGGPRSAAGRQLDRQDRSLYMDYGSVSGSPVLATSARRCGSIRSKITTWVRGRELSFRRPVVANIDLRPACSTIKAPASSGLFLEIVVQRTYPQVKAANLILKAVCAGRRTAAICNAFHF